jgi:hypothetical protein
MSGEAAAGAAGGEESEDGSGDEDNDEAEAIRKAAAARAGPSGKAGKQGPAADAQKPPNTFAAAFAKLMEQPAGAAAKPGKAEAVAGAETAAAAVPAGGIPILSVGAFVSMSRLSGVPRCIAALAAAVHKLCTALYVRRPRAATAGCLLPKISPPSRCRGLTRAQSQAHVPSPGQLASDILYIDNFQTGKKGKPVLLLYLTACCLPTAKPKHRQAQGRGGGGDCGAQ